MSHQPVEFYHRRRCRVEEETIYGDAFLRWTYGNPLGRLALHALVKRAVFSRVYGWFMDRPSSRKRVQPFIEKFALSADDFLEPATCFKTFNEFFYRRLKPQARPIDPHAGIAVLPADGRHLAFQNFSQAQGLFVKGQVFALDELLQSADLARRYDGGALVISRLCPVDYHRFHFPTAGIASPAQLLPGPLQSVNPIALKQNIRILATNRRCLASVESPDFGRVLTVEVGATCVGGFVYTFRPGVKVGKGDEKGYFKFGGSLTMTLFEPNRIRLDSDLLEQTQRGLETYALMGERMGSAL